MELNVPRHTIHRSLCRPALRASSRAAVISSRPNSKLHHLHCSGSRGASIADDNDDPTTSFAFLFLFGSFLDASLSALRSLSLVRPFNFKAVAAAAGFKSSINISDTDLRRSLLPCDSPWPATEEGLASPIPPPPPPPPPPTPPTDRKDDPSNRLDALLRKLARFPLSRSIWLTFFFAASFSSFAFFSSPFFFCLCALHVLAMRRRLSSSFFKWPTRKLQNISRHCLIANTPPCTTEPAVPFGTSVDTDTLLRLLSFPSFPSSPIPPPSPPSSPSSTPLPGSFPLGRRQAQNRALSMDRFTSTPHCFVAISNNFKDASAHPAFPNVAIAFTTQARLGTRALFGHGISSGSIDGRPASASMVSSSKRGTITRCSAGMLHSAAISSKSDCCMAARIPMVQTAPPLHRRHTSSAALKQFMSGRTPAAAISRRTSREDTSWSRAPYPRRTAT